MSIIYHLFWWTCMNMDIPLTTAWISSSYTKIKSIKVKNDYNSWQLIDQNCDKHIITHSYENIPMETFLYLATSLLWSNSIMIVSIIIRQQLSKPTYVGVVLFFIGCGHSMPHVCSFCQTSSSKNMVSSRNNITVKTIITLFI